MQLTFQQTTRNENNYNSTTVGVTRDVPEGEDPDLIMEEMRQLVHELQQRKSRLAKDLAFNAKSLDNGTMQPDEVRKHLKTL